MRKLLVSSALLVAACGSNERSIEVEDGNGESATVSVKGDGEKVTVQSAEGEVVYQQGAQGAVFPAYAPQYPGSTVTSSANFEGAKGAQGATLTQQTGDGVDKVLAFYKKKVTAAGLKVVMEQSAGDTATLVAAKEGANEMGVMISAAADGAGSTTISMSSGMGQ